MSVMTAQPPLPLVPAGAVEISEAVALVEDETGGRVYLRGELIWGWDAGDEIVRRIAAVQLVQNKAAGAGQVAGAFGIGEVTLWRWRTEAQEAGTRGLVPGRRGPKGPSKLSAELVDDIRARRQGDASLRQIAAAVGVSPTSVRRALAGAQTAEATESAERPETDQDDETDQAVGAVETDQADEAVGAEEAESVVGHDDSAGRRAGLAQVPVLARPARRGLERALARGGLLAQAAPVFTPAGRVPLAGLALGLPALEVTGLLACAGQVYGALPDGFYGLDTMLLEGVFGVLAGQPRAEGAGRLDPTDLGRVLGMDRAPEVKTIRRKIAQLADAGKGTELLGAMMRARLARQETDASDSLVLYVDGHTRAYQGTKKIAKTHSSRLRFPAPATVETWVSDGDGDPVLVVMAEPGASLAMELRRLLPELRRGVGDDRRVLVGFDRGGWSPTLFKDMGKAGFDVLTWRKQPAPDVDADRFAETTFVDETGRQHTWTLADTTIELALKDRGADGRGATFAMRQITRLDTKKGKTRQVHVITTRTDLDPGAVMYRMGSRWRQENYFRSGRLHLALDSHDTYAATSDDPDRSVPNPAKRHGHLAVQNTAARAEREWARVDAALLAARTPTPGSNETVLTNPQHNAITAAAFAAEDDLAAARARHGAIPARVRLGDLAPDQQVLDTETKLVTDAIKIAAFNTTTAIARTIRIHTGYARAEQEAYTLTRQALTQSGDIIPDHHTGTLTIRLDPLPTRRETTAVAELCAHLTATETTYPGTELTLRYEIKTRP